MKRNKYRAVRTEIDGIKFDSKKEAQRYLELKLLLHGGLIFDLQIQPPFKFIVNDHLICTYRGDFGYYLKDGTFVVEDVKSEVTRKLPTYRLKVKLLKAIYPGVNFREV